MNDWCDIFDSVIQHDTHFKNTTSESYSNVL